MHLRQSKLITKRLFSESLAKRSHDLYNEKLDNPVRSVLYDNARIQKICDKNQFESLSHSEKTFILANKLKTSMNHNGQYFSFMKSSETLTLKNEYANKFSEPPLDLIEKRAYNSNDYSVNVNESLQSLKNILKSVFPNQKSKEIINVLETEPELIASIHDFQQELSESSTCFYLNKKQLIFQNFGSDFSFFEFKKLIKSKSKNVFDFKIIRDYLGVPSGVRVSFLEESDLELFYKNQSELIFQNKKLKIICPENLKKESFRNRTIVLKGFASSVTETEILATVSQFARIENLVFPQKVFSEKIPYTSEVQSYIDKNLNIIGENLKVVAHEIGVNENKSFIIFDHEFNFEANKLIIEDIDLTQNDADSVLKNSKKHIKQQIKDHLKTEQVFEINTLHDSLKLKEDFRKSSPSKKRSLNDLINSKNGLADNLAEFSYLGNEKSAPSSILRKMKINNSGIDLQVNSLGVCFITFTSSWETKKAIYGLKYLSHFGKTEIDLLGQNDFAQFLDFIVQRVYGQIHLNHIKRDQLRNELLTKEDIANPEDSQTSMTDVHSARLRREQQLTNGDFDAKRIIETQYKEELRKREGIKQEVDSFLNTFVTEQNYSNKPYLKSNLADLGEIEEVLEKRGRVFGETTLEERLKILELQLEKSKEKFQKKNKDGAKLFNVGLNKVFKDQNKEYVRDALEKIGVEFGLKNNEIGKFKQLLQEKEIEKSGQRAEFDFDEKIRATEKTALRPPKINRMDIFNSIGGKKGISFRGFSHFHDKNTEFVSPEILYARLYKKLEDKYTGEYFEADWFAEFTVQNFLRKREK